MKKFRDEVFALCNILLKMNEFSDLRQTMAALRFSTQKSIIDHKIDVCTNGIHLRAEFYGILLAYQNKLTSFPNVDADQISLSDTEYANIALGHSYICQFIEMCLSDITSQYPIIGKLLSPYSFFKPINEIPDVKLDSSIFNKAVKSFKNTTVYHSLTDTNVLMPFGNMTEESMRSFLQLLYRDIINAPMDIVPNEIVSLKMREHNFKKDQPINPVDALQLVSFRLLALREMLSAAASLIYDAMLGSDLTVIDENRLINIEKNASNTIYSYKTILFQGGLFSPFNDAINIIFLLHIDNGKVKIHDFGRSRSLTFSFANENGDTTKLSYCVLDEELNPISNLTKN